MINADPGTKSLVILTITLEKSVISFSFNYLKYETQGLGKN